MSENLEIERKFLVEMPDIGRLNVVRCIDIVQTYLRSGKDGSQRRVRRITENGRDIYVYTEKIFYTAVTRRETEYEISAEDYEARLSEADNSLAPVLKRRVCFDYKKQLFELDIYPFSQKLAIMELELGSPEQEIFFPDTVRIVKEVTGDKAYSNSTLSVTRAFPDESPTEEI